MLIARLCKHSCVQLYVNDFLDTHKYRYELVGFAPRVERDRDFLVTNRYPLIDVARRDYSHGERVKIRW